MKDFIIRLASMKLAEMKFDVSIEHRIVQKRYLQENLSFKELEDRIVGLSKKHNAVLPLVKKVEIEEGPDGDASFVLFLYRGKSNKNMTGQGSKPLLYCFIPKPDSMSREIFKKLMESLLKRLELRGL